MDISQAAFGLDMSSASRVYFVNPVLSPQVEAQAVKRAHRIGQTKPVFVETLVLRGGIEEVILERRKDMTSEEHQKCKNILNDQKIYNWIRNVRFIPLQSDNGPGPDQMAKLVEPEHVFSIGTGSNIHEAYNPDADLIMSPTSFNSKGKRKASVAFQPDGGISGASMATMSKKKKTVAFGRRNSPLLTEYTNVTSADQGSPRSMEEESADKYFDSAERFNGTSSQASEPSRHLPDLRNADADLALSDAPHNSLAKQ
jgi:hypothetical protein